MSNVDRRWIGCSLGLSVLVAGITADAGGQVGASEDDGTVEIAGELQQWHKVTLNLAGPEARERDSAPNPFRDYRMQVRFEHTSGKPRYNVPGYFAADGQAADTSAESGNVWRAHLSPDKPGTWTYEVSFVCGEQVAVELDRDGKPVAPYHGQSGEFEVAPSDKQGRDFRARGRLEYVGKHYLRFAGDGAYFLKAGADAPETLLAYEDFDGTVTNSNVGLKTWQPHVRDWREGDPSWQDGKGKGLIGAVNYLSDKGANVFSFVPYNAGGDGDNVWPMIERDDKLHYDCSKLDQWQVLFDHATNRGIYLHFKLQETENDDLDGPGSDQALDGGELGVERKLYLREMVARYAHELALNWNLGEENTQSKQQQRDMAHFLRRIDPYTHPIVLHTYPNQQEKVYGWHLGDDTTLSGLSIQNSGVRQTHKQVVHWVKASSEAGHPWVVAVDEAGSAGTGSAPPDPGYEGFEGIDDLTIHDTRRYVLWGTLMGGGAGVEYYFGYQLPQNDLNAEDFRSRDRSWDYCRIALGFFDEHDIPFWRMKNRDELVGNPDRGNDRYALAEPGKLYLVYLPQGDEAKLDLSEATGSFSVQWFDPRAGGDLQAAEVQQIDGGDTRSLGDPPSERQQDWLAVVRLQ